MVSKEYWKKSIVEFTNLVKQEKEKKFVTVLNTSFEVFPNVFSPVYSSDTTWFAEKILPLVRKKRFLEIGSGVIACLAALHGAESVVATDINPDAVKNVIVNAALHSVPIAIRTGNVFDPISSDELFDVIFWNHPFFHLEEKINKDDLISLSVYDTQYQALRNFFHKGQIHLKKDGQLILGTSNIARINLIKKIGRGEGYSICLLEKTQVPIYKDKKVKMDLRLYSFKPLH